MRTHDYESVTRIGNFGVHLLLEEAEIDWEMSVRHERERNPGGILDEIYSEHQAELIEGARTLRRLKALLRYPNRKVREPLREALKTLSP